jgi:hypothetical protein
MQYAFCVFVSGDEGVQFLFFLYELISRAEFRKLICQASSGSRHHLPKASIYDRGGIAAVSQWLDDLQALPYLLEMCSLWRWGEYQSVLSFFVGSILRAIPHRNSLEAARFGRWQSKPNPKQRPIPPCESSWSCPEDMGCTRMSRATKKPGPMAGLS